VARGGALCFKCHASIKESLAKAHVHPPAKGGRECLSCHGPHGAVATPLLVQAQPALCFGCHDRKILAGAVRSKTMREPPSNSTRNP